MRKLLFVCLALSLTASPVRAQEPGPEEVAPDGETAAASESAASGETADTGEPPAEAGPEPTEDEQAGEEQAASGAADSDPEPDGAEPGAERAPVAPLRELEQASDDFTTRAALPEAPSAPETAEPKAAQVDGGDALARRIAGGRAREVSLPSREQVKDALGATTLVPIAGIPAGAALTVMEAQDGNYGTAAWNAAATIAGPFGTAARWLGVAGKAAIKVTRQGLELASGTSRVDTAISTGKKVWSRP